MDLRQVEYVVAVVDHGGFTRAAAALHVAQPSLSQSVRRLEAELGAPLFARIGRTVQLTAAGESFLGPARRLLRDADGVRAAVAEHVELATGRLDLVALPTLVADPLVPLVGRFRARYPAVTVRISDPAGPADLLAMVADGRCELGFTEAGPVREGLTSRPLGRQDLHVVLPPGTTVRGSLTPAALATHPLVLGPPGTSAREAVEQALGRVGAQARVAVETDQREAVVPLVLAGAGATVLPAPVAAEAAARGAVVAACTPGLSRRLVLVHRATDLSPAAAALLHIAVGERPSRPRPRRRATMTP